MMIGRELQVDLINKALANGGEYADFFLEYRRHTSLLLEGGKLEKISSGSETGAGIRLIAGDKTAYAFSNDLSGEALTRAAAEVSLLKAGPCLR